MEDLKKMLIKISKSSRTAKLWVMCFIGPIFTTNTHIIVVRKGHWALHLAMEDWKCIICVGWRSCHKM